MKLLSQYDYVIDSEKLFDKALVEETGLTVQQFIESSYTTSSDYGRCIQHKLGNYYLQKCGDKPYYELHVS